ncbi:MAG: hypothetical protein AAF415_11500 [Pseudomonadota bacterium]
MKLTPIHAPALAIVIAMGLAISANAETTDVSASPDASVSVAQETKRGGLRPRHDGKSGVHRTRSKLYLADPGHGRRPVADNSGPSLVERLFN